jgi:hypothetical protein
LKARFLRLYPAQSDIPVSAVKKNPLKQIFLTKKGGEKGAFFIDKRKSCMPAERGGENLSGLWTTATFYKLLGIERFLYDQETAAEG